MVLQATVIWRDGVGDMELDVTNPTSIDSQLILNLMAKDCCDNNKESLLTQNYQIKDMLVYMVLDNSNQKNLVRLVKEVKLPTLHSPQVVLSWTGQGRWTTHLDHIRMFKYFL